MLEHMTTGIMRERVCMWCGTREDRSTKNLWLYLGLNPGRLRGRQVLHPLRYATHATVKLLCLTSSLAKASSFPCLLTFVSCSGIGHSLKLSIAICFSICPRLAFNWEHRSVPANHSHVQLLINSTRICRPSLSRNLLNDWWLSFQELDQLL